MSYNRRDFLMKTGLAASAFAFGSLGCNNEPKTEEQKKDSTGTSAAQPGKPLGDFGLQLYTLRDDMPKDPKGILKQVASFGYKQIEGFEGPLGIWWGMTHTDLKKYVDDLGLNFISSHCDTHKDFEKKAAQAGEIGMKYLIAPWVGPQKKIDDFKKIADDFNRLGEI